MNSNDKKGILAIINNIPLNEILGFIKSEEISHKEMIDAGLNSEISNNIKMELEREAAAKLAEELLVLQKKEAERINLQVAEEKKYEVEKLCAQIENGDLGVDALRELIISDKISQSYLIQHTSLTLDLISKIKNYKKNITEFESWEKAPPLKLKSTDIYFFGQPGSGKSCILASLFFYFEKEGMMMSSVANPYGMEYRNLLINEIRNGILPHSTQKDTINFIPIELNENKNRHPLNFVEMSGELFKDASKIGFSSPDLIKLKGYLDNNNRKLIFFVVDYYQHNNGTSQNQSSFTDVLEWLDINKILDKTDGIYILLTKADLFPKGVDHKEYASQFLDREYLNFKNNARDKKNKHRNQFKIFLFPYSIGEVKYQNLLTNFDYKSPSYISKAIINHSFVSEKSFLGKLFN